LITAEETHFTLGPYALNLIWALHQITEDKESGVYSTQWADKIVVQNTDLKKGEKNPLGRTSCRWKYLKKRGGG